MLKRAMLLAGATVLSMSSAAVAQPATASATPDAATEDARLTAFLDAEFAKDLALRPQLATRLGMKEGKDRLDDTSEAAQLQRLEARRAELDRATADLTAQRAEAERELAAAETAMAALPDPAVGRATLDAARSRNEAARLAQAHGHVSRDHTQARAARIAALAQRIHDADDIAARLRLGRRFFRLRLALALLLLLGGGGGSGRRVVALGGVGSGSGSQRSCAIGRSYSVHGAVRQCPLSTLVKRPECFTDGRLRYSHERSLVPRGAVNGEPDNCSA